MQKLSKNLNKYVAVLTYRNKTLPILSAVTQGVFLVSFATTFGALVGIVGVSVTVVLLFSNEIIFKKN